MSLILAFKAYGKIHLCSDRRVLCTTIIRRDQEKIIVLSKHTDPLAINIVVGLCGDMRFITLMRDQRNLDKIIEAYKEAPTIYGLVDGIVKMFEGKGTEPHKDPGSQGSYNLRMLIGLGNAIYEVGPDLTINQIPETDLATVGSGSTIALAYWDGRMQKRTRQEARVGLIRDQIVQMLMAECVMYASSVESTVGTEVSTYTYDLQVPA